MKYSPKPIVIVCSADNNYAMQMTIMIVSVANNLDKNQNVILFILDGGIDEGNKEKIIQSLKKYSIEIHWVCMKHIAPKNMKISGHITVTTYYRIIIPELLPNEFEKVIYLDGDLIVNKNLDKLWNIELDDNYILAVQDMAIPYVSSPLGLSNYQELGIHPEKKYLNGGVLVVNLKKWREDNISGKIIAYLEVNKDKVLWWDQDGLNALLYDKWGELDPRWNQTPFIYKYSSWQDSPFEEEVYNQVINEPYIIHFASGDKPWHPGYQHPKKELFLHYADLTAWSGLRYRLVWQRIWNKISKEVNRIWKQN